MATYFTARKAEKVFTKYKALVIGYWDAQPPDNRGWMGRNAPAPEGQESIALREQIVSLYPEANSYANALGLSVTAHNYPPPAVGGPVIPVNLLYGAVDRDAGHSRLPKQTVLDTINRCLATATATRKRLLWSQLLNPVCDSKEGRASCVSRRERLGPRNQGRNFRVACIGIPALALKAIAEEPD